MFCSWVTSLVVRVISEPTETENGQGCYTAAFMDEYFTFMKTYDETDESQEEAFLELIGEYTDKTRVLTDWEKKGLNEEEQKYYTAALGRVGEKQLEADIALG